MIAKTYWRAMSHFGRFRVEGTDAAQLLHHLTTNHIKKLQSDEGCDAVLITNKARVLDWLTIWRTGDAYEVLTSPNRRALFVPHARKFVLYRQDVRFQDISENGALYGLFGDGTKEVLASWNAAQVLDAPLNVRIAVEVEGATLWLSRARRLPGDGVLVECDDYDTLQQSIGRTSVSLCDDETYNILRVEAGIPVAGLELTEEINPWEAGLDFAISLDKGCYNGQEVVARLNTYQKIKQRLFGLKLETPLAMSAVASTKIQLKSDGRDAGYLTSSVESPRLGALALGYVRTDFQQADRTLQVLSSPAQAATVTPLPFKKSV
jgi:folate-binding protein YgfZ